MSVPGWQPSGDEIRQARERIKPFITATPLLRAEALDRPGRRVFIKPENLQRTGSFKVRGAFNAMASLTPEQKAAGVVTYSSGNHAQALALAARELGLTERGQAYPCRVYMPRGANPLKIARTEALGAEIEYAGLSTEDRRKAAVEFGHAQGRTVIPSYDDPRIICGQGTLGVEIMDQWMGMPSRTRRLGLVATPLGGGGLLSGTAAALRTRGYGGRVVGVEPAAGNDTQQSLAAGKRVEIPLPETVCDGLMAVMPGEFTFAILQKTKAEAFAVSEDQTKAAAFWLLDEMKLLVEPSGAVAVAAWKAGVISDDSGGSDEVLDVVLLLSGGNADPSLIAGWRT